MRTKEELERTKGYWYETIENCLYRIGISMWRSKRITRKLLKNMEPEKNEDWYILNVLHSALRYIQEQNKQNNNGTASK